jgi:hypothetical protein
MRSSRDILYSPRPSSQSAPKRDILSSPVKTSSTGRQARDLLVSPLRNSTPRTVSILSSPVRPFQPRTPKRKRIRLAQKPKSPVKRAQYAFNAALLPVDVESTADVDQRTTAADDYNVDEYHNVDEYNEYNEYNNGQDRASDDLSPSRQLDWAARNAALLRFKEEEVLLYWRAVEFTPFSVARLSSRCFVLRDWDIKRKSLIVAFYLNWLADVTAYKVLSFISHHRDEWFEGHTLRLSR